MGDCLRVGSDHIVLFVGEMNVTRLETSKHILNQLYILLRSSVMYNNLPCQPSSNPQTVSSSVDL